MRRKTQDNIMRWHCSWCSGDIRVLALVLLPELNQAYQQHRTVGGHSWSHLSLFGLFRFWTSGASKKQLWNKGCRGAEDVNQPKEWGLYTTNTPVYCPSIRPLHCHSTILIWKANKHSSIEDRGGDRQEEMDGEGQAAQLHSQKTLSRLGNNMLNASP